jgi:predicted dehydrogenase
MNVLIVGLGSIAQKHIYALKLIGNFTIYALRNNLQAKSEEGIINIFDLNELNIPIEFAIISNPTHLHATYISLLAKMGIPLFIEKPAIASLKDADAVMKVVTDQNLLTYVACNLRFHPCLTYLKELITPKTLAQINEVNVYCGSYLPDWRPGKDFKTIYSANPEMGGGVHLDLFHELDYTHWIFGQPLHSHVYKTNTSSLGIKAYDYANYTLAYDKFTASIILNYYRRTPKRTIEILLEDDTLLVDLIANKITDAKGQIIFETENFSILTSYVAQMKYFLACLKQKDAPMNSLKESITVLKTCLSNEF